jgi:hypothetical protein
MRPSLLLAIIFAVESFVIWQALPGGLLAGIFESLRIAPLVVNQFSISLMVFWTAFLVHKAWLHGGKIELQLRDFSYYLFGYALFAFISASLFFVPTYFPAINAFTVQWGWLLMHIPLYIGIAIFQRVPLAWVNPQYRNWGMTAYFILFAAIIFLYTTNLPTAENAIGPGIFIAVVPLVGTMHIINMMIGRIPAGLYFFYKGFKSTDSLVRTRALLLGMGIIGVALAGPLHNAPAFRSTEGFALLDVLFLAATLIQSLGMLYKRQGPQAKTQSQ